jgi:hypothetical protein
MTVTIGRRELLAALRGAAVSLPLAARAQQSGRLIRLGFLGPTLSMPQLRKAFSNWASESQQMGTVSRDRAHVRNFLSLFVSAVFAADFTAERLHCKLLHSCGSSNSSRRAMKTMTPIIAAKNMAGKETVDSNMLSACSLPAPLTVTTAPDQCFVDVDTRLGTRTARRRTAPRRRARPRWRRSRRTGGGSEGRGQAGWRCRFRTIQVCPKDPRALPGHPELR